ncbi:MAG: glycosyltransferase [Chthoniobacterales bacterium]
MKKVLIVSPHFPPINAPDMQRVRVALSYFKEFGWEPTVLCVDANYIEAAQDSWLEHSLPQDIRIIKSKAFSAKLTRRFGFGSLSFRATPFLNAEGNKLLAREKFDVSFFSTTQFGVMSLAAKWRARYGLPYVLDIQDPWVSNYDYAKNARPGGRLKYAVSQWSARRTEPVIAKGAAGIISVSSAYVKDIETRYPEIPAERFAVIPFAGAEHDFEFVQNTGIQQRVFNPSDGLTHWVYTGRGGSDLKKSLSGIFEALRQFRLRDPQSVNKIRIHFIGTSYAPEGRGEKSIEPVANEFGVADLVKELPTRLPYFETLRCMLDAQALIIPGSDDAGYTASKIYPCILARKPILAVFHEKSSVLTILNETNAGTGVDFSPSDSTETIAKKIVATNWLSEGYLRTPETNWENFEPYLARSMTRSVCQILDKAITR